MISTLPTSRRHRVLLGLLSSLLFLGIVQWSFLPILIQNGPVGGKAVLEMSAGHSSKFAAPYKYLFGDDVSPCLVQSGLDAPSIALVNFPLPHNPPCGHDEVSFASRQLRAPPSA